MSIEALREDDRTHPRSWTDQGQNRDPIKIINLSSRHLIFPSFLPIYSDFLRNAPSEHFWWRKRVPHYLHLYVPFITSIYPTGSSVYLLTMPIPEAHAYIYIFRAYGDIVPSLDIVHASGTLCICLLSALQTKKKRRQTHDYHVDKGCVDEETSNARPNYSSIARSLFTTKINLFKMEI